MSRVPELANLVAVDPWPSYAVVLKMLKSLDDPNACKQLLDSVCPDSAEISELRKLKQDWKLYVKSKSSAEKMKASKPDVAAMLKEKLFIAILRRVPPSMTHTDVETVVPSASKAIEIGNFERSKVFKLHFETRKDLEDFLAVSVRVVYEKLPAEEFKFLLKRCFSCHAVGHIADDCVLTPICCRCGAPDDTCTKDNRCTKDYVLHFVQKERPYMLKCKVSR